MALVDSDIIVEKLKGSIELDDVVYFFHVSIPGPMDSAGEIPLSSKKSSINSKVIDWDFDIFLQNFQIVQPRKS